MTFSPSQTYNLSVPGCGDAQCREAAAEPDGGVAAPNDVDGGRVHEPHGRGRAGEAKGKVHQRTECAHTQPPCRHVEPTAPSHRPRTEKHPNFKPSMLEPPKPKFKAVSLEGGPIIKEHSRRNTGLETKRPYQWGPLGGYY